MSSFRGRIRERDLYLPVLRAAASKPNGCIATSELIAEMEDEFQPDGEDAKILEGRKDSKFSQIVRNVVVHRASRTSIFSKGHAVYHEDSETICITEDGRDYVSDAPDE